MDVTLDTPFEEYYSYRLERLEKSGLTKLMTWDASCANFFYSQVAKQFMDLQMELLEKAKSAFRSGSA